jgi:tetratricopeptide (TPR) repeat protein
MRRFRWTLVVSILCMTGCAAFQIAGQVQSGRRALLANDPQTALAYLQPAADKDPNHLYQSMNFQESVWTYVGRAQYELGRLPEAKQSLERALAAYKDDAMARLYLGLTLLRAGNRAEGRRQIAAGLKEIANWIEYLNSTRAFRSAWDPNAEIRKEIDRGLAMMEGEKPASDKEIIESGEWVGKKMEEEIDKVRLDDQRDFRREHDFGPGFGFGLGIGF